MYCRVFASDFDGTGATGDRLGPELAAALEVLGDVQLASGLRKLELLTRTGAAPSRDEILDNVNDQDLV